MTDAIQHLNTDYPYPKRPNYFAGQYLLAEDFKSEQNYHIDRQRRHNRLLHVSGIAEGLKVILNEPQERKVKVTAGTAFDNEGRQIILLADIVVDLEQVTIRLATDVDNVQDGTKTNPIPEGDYIFSIKYREEQTDQQGEENTTTRVQEKPNFVLRYANEPNDEDGIVLAKISVKKNVVKDCREEARQYSGIYLPAYEGKGVTLRSLQGQNQSPKAIIEGSLRITGKLEIYEDCEIKKELKVENDVIVKTLKIGDETATQKVTSIVKEITELHNEIASPGQKHEETIPTSAAVMTYVSRRVSEIRMTTESGAPGNKHVMITIEGKARNIVVPITLLKKEGLIIKTNINKKERQCDLKSVESDTKQEKMRITETSEGWTCYFPTVENMNKYLRCEIEEVRRAGEELLSSRTYSGIQMGTRLREVRHGYIENIGIGEYEYENDQWKVRRKRNVLEYIREELQKTVKDVDLNEWRIAVMRIKNSDVSPEMLVDFDVINREGEASDMRKGIVVREEGMRRIIQRMEEEEKTQREEDVLPPTWKAIMTVY
jgi:hypothetical protein